MTSFTRLNGVHCGWGRLGAKSSSPGDSKFLGQFDTYERCLSAALNDAEALSAFSIVYGNFGATGDQGYQRNCHAIINSNLTTFVKDDNMICGLNYNKFTNPATFLSICPSCPSGPTGPSGPSSCRSGYTGPTGPCPSKTPYYIGMGIIGGIAVLLLIVLLLKLFKVF